MDFEEYSKLHIVERMKLLPLPPDEFNEGLEAFVKVLRYCRDELGYEVDQYLSHHTDFMIGISKIPVGETR